MSPEDLQLVEKRLAHCTKLNLSSAPACDRLPVFYAMRRQNLDEAQRLALTAVELASVRLLNIGTLQRGPRPVLDGTVTLPRITST